MFFRVSLRICKQDIKLDPYSADHLETLAPCPVLFLQQKAYPNH